MSEDLIYTSSYINGQWVKGTSTTSPLIVSEKFTNQTLATIPFISESQMDEAITAAETAFQTIRNWSAEQRSNTLTAIHDALKAQQEAFALLIVKEAGKPIDYARTEIQRSLHTLKIAAREALQLNGETVPIDFGNGTGKTAFTERFPIGPIACISPFNFPLNLALHKIAPALAVGCSVVLKPAPQTPLVALAFAHLVHSLDLLPPGTLNVVVADIPVSAHLVKDTRMKMLSFTGSPTVGWALKQICGKKKVALELGGNAAVIVDETADLAGAAKQIAIGAFLYAGQICISTQRIFVHEKIKSRFLPLLLDAIQQLKIGNPLTAGITVGPIIQDIHLQRIEQWVSEALDNGARLLTGGHVIDRTAKLYAPTLLDQVQPNMKVYSEEVFGPVATLSTFKTFSQAIDLVNDSPFGLQAGVFTDSIHHMKLAQKQLEVGGIMMNSIPGFRLDNMPYGGIKDSGLGREGVLYAMQEMTEPKLLIY